MLKPKRWFKVIVLKPGTYTERGAQNRIQINHSIGFEPTVKQIIEACKQNDAYYTLNNEVYYICSIVDGMPFSFTERQLRGQKIKKYL
jgi:hypothetical protein